MSACPNDGLRRRCHAWRPGRHGRPFRGRSCGARDRVWPRPGRARLRSQPEQQGRPARRVSRQREEASSTGHACPGHRPCELRQRRPWQRPRPWRRGPLPRPSGAGLRRARDPHALSPRSRRGEGRGLPRGPCLLRRGGRYRRPPAPWRREGRSDDVPFPRQRCLRAASTDHRSSWAQPTGPLRACPASGRRWEPPRACASFRPRRSWSGHG